MDFRNTILIMTSNIGANLIKHATSLGFILNREEDKQMEEEYKTMRDRVMGALKDTFRPEFLNRVDGIMVFRSLSKDQIKNIVDLELKRVQDQLVEQDLTLDVADEVRSYIAEEGYDADYGARPLRRAIQDKLEDRLSEALLNGEFKPGYTVRVTLGEDKELVFEPQPPSAKGEDGKTEVAEALPG